MARRISTSDDPTRRERLQSVRFHSEDEVHVVERYEDEGVRKERKFLSSTAPASTSAIRSTMYRSAGALLFLGALISLLQSFGFIGHEAALPIQGVSGGVVPPEAQNKRDAGLERRAVSRTNWCFKWGQMSAIVNGTLYLYGGQVATTSEQTEFDTTANTWTKDFISVDMTKEWQTGGPPFKGLQQPSEVPAVSLGYLWSSKDSLWLYGGEYTWKDPSVEPAPFSTWQYYIPSGEWIEHADPVTSAGLSAPNSGVAVQRSAEGAGVNVPTLGRGFYMGGHLDAYTTPGWDVQVPRVYLKSLLEFTFPGSSNEDVTSLQDGSVAGTDGVYRNVTQGGIQNNGFTKRADSILAYVPGYGDEGVLVSLGGGTNDTFTQMNIINVYDIATSTWTSVGTSGEYPEVRVNPCSVVAAAADGSSYQIYMFGGQDLVPAGSQEQKDDMWILSVPSFIWIKVDQSGQSVPPGRSGATCNIWDGQMVMIGGYLGDPDFIEDGLTCEFPATYVYDLSNLIWQTQFTSLADSEDGPVNFLNQQPGQVYSGKSMGGLEGSYGYKVPQAVRDQIGGDEYGGATITKPVVTATPGQPEGPFRTGTPIVYSTETVVSQAGSLDGGSNDGTRTAAIVVGVICGLAFIVICYLLFCLFVYRKQLALYKRHVEMSQAQARGEKAPEIPGLWATDSAQYDSDQSKPRISPGDTGSHMGSNHPSQPGSGAQTGSNNPNSGTQSARRSSEQSSTEDLLADHEPTFVGVMLNPRRSLRVINRD